MLVRVFVKGGILSPGDFARTIEVAQALGSDYVHLGSRQDILFPVQEKDTDKIEGLLQSLPLPYEYGQKQHQNIVSSYITLDVVASSRWLAPHIYHYVLDSFDYKPTHKINISDPLQGMVPLFTGNINFVASTIDNYWYLYIRYTELGPKPWCCPDLIYGFDLAKVAKGIEELDPVSNHLSFPEIYTRLKDSLHFNIHTIDQPLKYPEMFFPYYEGINRIESNKYWMGLYWRNNKFTIRFLQVLCQQCLKTDTGMISLTPWKSIIVKGIIEKDRLEWEKLLGKYGINMRHSSLELNWHLPVADQEALDLKNYLVRALDQQDISTYGLTFTVKNQKHKVLFTSVVIEWAEKEDERQPDLYNILFAKDFNPNLFEFLYYAKGVSKEIIPPLLIELSKKYYEQLNAEKYASVNRSRDIALPVKKTYQCNGCLSIYDAAYGDELSNVPAGTPFRQLPEDYQCPVCGNPKGNFEEIVLPE